MLDEYQRDVDIVRLKIYKQNKDSKKECTFEEEMLPPPYRYDLWFSMIYNLLYNVLIKIFLSLSLFVLYRRHVQQLMKKANKNNTTKFKYNSGQNYYPFTK